MKFFDIAKLIELFRNCTVEPAPPKVHIPEKSFSNKKSDNVTEYEPSTITTYRKLTMFPSSLGRDPDSSGQLLTSRYFIDRRSPISVGSVPRRN
jgi:hypothetical protein